MLTLVKTKDAVALVNIYEIPERDPGSKMHEKRQAAKKKQVGTVYFTHDMDAKNSNVSEAAGVLGMHKEHLKKQTHISEHEFDEIAQMLDDEEEPDMHHPLKHAYWNIRQNFDRYLQREMYIGDDPTSVFELNLPTKRRDWPGTMTLIGSSGAGKTRFLTDLMLRYLKATPEPSAA
jgi:flagellar biosynthesis GTPase FlhF